MKVRGVGVVPVLFSVFNRDRRDNSESFHTVVQQMLGGAMLGGLAGGIGSALLRPSFDSPVRGHIRHVDFSPLLFSRDLSPEEIEALTERMGFVPRGLDRSTVEGNTVVHKYAGPGAEKQGEECMICMDKFEEGQELRQLPCLHRYHRPCIDRWLEMARECPVCKHVVTSSEVPG